MAKTEGLTIRVPVKLISLYQKLAGKRNPTPKELAVAMGISVDRAKHLLKIQRRS